MLSKQFYPQSDVDDFFQQCDPETKNLCLFGSVDGTWFVDEHEESMPPHIPQPTLGINFSRDKLALSEWLSSVAEYSDSWLFSLTYFFALRFGFSHTDRAKLFKMINSVRTVSEAVNMELKPPIDQSVNPSSSNSKSSKQKRPALPKEVGKDVDELCGVCRAGEKADEFWILCDVCQGWFHGECVKITRAEADQIKLYKCPTCCNSKRPTSAGYSVMCARYGFMERA